MKVTVGTTPTLLIGKNIKREKVVLQNTGAENVYVKKWAYPNAIAPIVTPTDYDFILFSKPGEGNKENEIEQIGSVSAYVGVTESKTSTVAVMETVKAVL